jgi:AAHS family benzoate transporter-like MFS transporter
MEAHEEFLVPAEDRAEGAPVGKLFRDGRGLSTVMFWIAFFMGLFMIYALSSWLTKLMAMSGYSLGSALTFFLVLQCGAMVGAISGGWLADKFHIKYVLIVMYLLGAMFLYMMTVKTSQEVLYVIVALVGATTTGTQILTYAYAGQFYPTAIRSTGIGFASGVGRAGAILAPILIGFLVSLNLPLNQNFLVIASAGLMGAIAVAFISHRVSASAHQIDATREDVLPASTVAAAAAPG